MRPTAIAAWLSTALLACATAEALARPAGAAAAKPERAPFRAHCDRDDDDAHARWALWSRDTLPVSAGGVDFTRVKQLAAKSPATAERMLRLGLQVCDATAAQAVSVTGLRALLPELKDLLVPANILGGLGALGRFAPLRVEVVRAANAVDPATDYAPVLVRLLADGDGSVRIAAALGARNFRKDGVREALLDAVGTDASTLVRYHAAESLLALGDVTPRRVSEQPELAALIKGPDKGDPTPQDLERFGRGAQLLDRLMAERATAPANGKRSDGGQAR